MFDNVDDAFKQLDQIEYWPFADALSSYRDALISKGFTRRESMRLIEAYAKFIYEWALDEAVNGPNDDDLPDADDAGEGSL